MAKQEYKEARKTTAGKKLSHIDVHKSANGGHVVTHHYHSDGIEYHRPQDHVFGADEGDLALRHIAKHAGMNAEGRDRDRENASEDDDENIEGRG